jgi:hypothetical protein
MCPQIVEPSRIEISGDRHVRRCVSIVHMNDVAASAAINEIVAAISHEEDVVLRRAVQFVAPVGAPIFHEFDPRRPSRTDRGRAVRAALGKAVNARDG